MSPSLVRRPWPQQPRRRVAQRVALLPLVLTACVVPTVGPATAYQESQRAPFQVQSETLDTAPRASSVAGALDIVGTGQVALVQGWTTTSTAVLVIVSDVQLRVVDQQREQRPDVATTAGVPTDLDLGFRLRVEAERGLVGRLCVLAQRPDGVVEALNGSDGEWCAPR